MTKSKLSKRSAVFIIIAAAVVLAVIVLICSGGSGSGLTTTEKRVEYLASLGWDADPASETAKEIVLPETLGGVLAEYNELQKQQGFDLSQYCGEVCESYTYMLNSYPIAIENGLRFAIREGGRTVGSGVVIGINE